MINLLLIALISVVSAPCFAEMEPDMGEVCYEWQGFKTENEGYEMFKESVKGSGSDPDELDPKAKIRVMAAKAKFESAKRKYVKKSGKKFDSKKCD